MRIQASVYYFRYSFPLGWRVFVVFLTYGVGLNKVGARMPLNMIISYSVVCKPSFCRTIEINLHVLQRNQSYSRNLNFKILVDKRRKFIDLQRGCYYSTF